MDCFITKNPNLVYDLLHTRPNHQRVRLYQPKRVPDTVSTRHTPARLMGRDIAALSLFA